MASYALLLVAYLPGLYGGFLFDDFGNIVDNPSIRLTQLSLQTLAGSLVGPDAGPLGRPVSVLSFAVTHYFFGLDPFAFKALNLAIHAVNGLLVARLAALLLDQFGSRSLSPTAKRWLPIWVAAIWLLHPINTIPVLLSVQRMTLLSGMFVLLALISHLKAMTTHAPITRGAWLIASWLVFWPLAIFSKETGFLFPLFAMLVFGATATSPPRTGYPSAIPWPMILSAVALSAALAALLNHLGWNWLERGYAMRPFTMTDRLLTEARVLWFYAGQVILPSHSKFGIYLDDFALSRGLFDPASTALALFGWGMVIAGLVISWRRWPMASFAVAWFLVGHSLESTFLPLEIAHEYRNYIPGIGLILGVGHLGANWLESLRLDYRRLTICLAGLFPIAVLATFTWMRAEQWGDPLRGTQLEAMHHPSSARANYTAAQVLFSSGRGDANDPLGGQMIRYHFLTAAANSPAEKLPHLGLIFWACASRRPLETEWRITLQDRLEHTPYSPKDRELPGNMLEIVLNQPTCLDRREAIDLFTAGSRNINISRRLRAAFLDSAADYELLVSKDMMSARTFLDQAQVLDPGNPSLTKKLRSFDEALGEFVLQGR